jgi:phosphoribosyl-AMP cyclohydrolase
MPIGNKLKYGPDGLIPAVIQDIDNGQVLMLAYMNKEALEKTLQTGRVHFFSRSRKKLWIKGEISGHTQELKEIYVDCDTDTLLIKVKQKVAACHEGYRSCFYRQLNPAGINFEIKTKKIFDPKDVYHKGNEDAL